MKRRIRLSRLRKAAIFTVASLVLGAALTIPTVNAAADTTTKYLGVFRQSSPTEIAPGTVSRYGVTPASVQWFESWATGNAFNAAEARTLWNQGIMLHYTWEPWNTALSVSDPNQIHLQDIVNGEWDSYIRARGAEFAAAGVPLMVRWGHEFNGNWYPWAIVNNSSNPALYISAYRRVHDLVVAAGATNVQWVWCFNNSSTPDASYNDPARSYPGDAYVDWVAIDGYNWGQGPSWDPAGNYWTSFDSMFSSAYSGARAIAPRRPVMIAEVGSSEDGGNKAQWINDMSTALQSGRYPDLKNIVYFDQNKEELWSGTSSSATQTAFTSWVNQTYMRGRGTELAQVAAQYQGTTPPPTTAPPTTPPPTTAPPTTPPPTTPPPAPGACSATYRTVNSWSGGFQGEVTVRAGTSVINAWTTRWTLASGQTIGQLWNGTLSISGSSVTVRNATWNGSLAANGSTTFGFVANGSPSAPVLTCANS
nr:cellulose binding domain-containing protein [Micromonospora sp. DSM 115978]